MINGEQVRIGIPSLLQNGFQPFGLLTGNWAVMTRVEEDQAEIVGKVQYPGKRLSNEVAQTQESHDLCSVVPADGLKFALATRRKFPPSIFRISSSL